MRKKVNLAEKLAGFGERFSPKIVDQLNDYKIEVVIPFPRLKHSRPASAHLGLDDARCTQSRQDPCFRWRKR
jgi:hypothetical protein